MSAFVPRPYFAFPSVLPSWYPGHMRRALRVMDERIAQCDLLIEVRDARLPLTSVNPAFSRFSGESVGQRAARLVVYCKRDLGDRRFEEPIRQAFEGHLDYSVAFVDTRKDGDVKQVLRQAVELAQEYKHRFATGLASAPRHHRQQRLLPGPNYGQEPEDLQIMVVGMPNVGKSSLLNALRRVGVNKGKAAFTGAEAGVTRKVTSVVKVWEKPNTYIHDTPGIMRSYLGKGDFDAEQALKMALSGGIKEGLIDLEVIADYLLYRITHRFFSADNPTPHNLLPDGLRSLTPPLPTNDLSSFLTGVASRIGALKKGGIADEERVCRWLITAFRDGRLGSWSLDDLTFTGPSYFLLEDNRQRLQLPPPTATPVALVSQENYTGIPASLNSLTVAKDMPFLARVKLSVDTYLATQEHNALYPRPETMSTNQLRKVAKEKEVELRMKRWQRTGVIGQSRFRVTKGTKGRKMHLRTRTGKSSLAFKRANKIRKRIRKQRGR